MKVTTTGRFAASAASALLLTSILSVPAPASAPASATTRVSVASDGSQTNNSDSGVPAISGDGRYAAFESYATNLVPGDTNNLLDVFLQDRDTGGTERVSVGSDGSQASGSQASGGHSSAPAINADGRYVAFGSLADNLVPGDTNRTNDVFVRDRVTGSTERVSVASDGSQAEYASFQPAISADGRYVAFWSQADNLVPGDTNRASEVFVRDRVAGSTERVSVASDGTQSDSGHSLVPAISADGRYVAFWSFASNLAAGDTNGVQDVFVRDRATGSTERVSVASDGGQATGGVAGGSISMPTISADGRYVAFESLAENLVPGDTNGAHDAFVRDRVEGSTERVSVAADGGSGSGRSVQAAISADGRYVAFGSLADNLVPGDTNGAYDVFVRDRLTGSTERVSIASDGSQANDLSLAPAISADGRYVAFASFASNLVPDDTNGTADVFLRYRDGGAPSDTTPPTLTLPDPITTEATGPAGTTLPYTATATDDTDANPAVACGPSSGSSFPLGGTTVTCTATDASGNQATGSFTVTVIDTSAPALTLPADQTIDATGPWGVAVSYTSTATDTVDTNPAVTCAPPSGSVFPLGATAVTCTATDASGNQVAGSFIVTVVGASRQMEDLEALVRSYRLTATVETSLLTKVISAQDALAADRTAATCSKLADFLGQVADFHTARKLKATQATELIAETTWIRAVLGC
ncbi:HYR domain-containing protein [Arthrobacter sp. R4-81]